MAYIDALNNKLNDQNIKFKLKSAVFDPKLLSLTIELVYDDGLILNEKIKSIVSKHTKQEFSKIKKIIIKYKKAYFDENILNKEIKKLISKNYSRLVPNRIVLSKDKQRVDIVCDEIFRDYASIIDITEKCQEYIEKVFNVNLEFFVSFEDSVKEDTKEKLNIKQDSTPQTYSVGGREGYIGDIIDGDPFQISAIKSPIEGVVVCGRITNIVETSTKPRKDKEGNPLPSKKYFKFTLSDFTGDLSGIYFPSQTNLSKMEKLAVGLDIIVLGNIEEDKYNGGLTIRPLIINLCILPKDFLEITIKKPVPKTYKHIVPEEITTQKQVNLFEMGKKEEVLPYLEKNTFVVFDFETTGLDGMSDKIVEIGAVKVEGGKPTQIFSCLVNPEMPIPKESSLIHNIYDKDVAGAYTISQVLPDFYKFCYGTTLVAYNIDFDFKFLSIAGRQNGYSFENPKIDAMVLARKALRGLLKNFRLATVANFLDVSLVNAHRAVDDALATAEVFVKLVTQYKELL